MGLGSDFDRILTRLGLRAGTYRCVALGKGVVGKSTSAFLALCTVLVLLSSNIWAQDQTYKNILNNLAHEMLECHVFYTIVEVCIRKRREPSDKGVIEQTEKVRTHLLEQSILLTKEAGLKVETIGARTKMVLNSMNNEIGNDCGNISLLLVKHGKVCKALSENFEQRANELLKQELRRDQNIQR